MEVALETTAPQVRPLCGRQVYAFHTPSRAPPQLRLHGVKTPEPPRGSTISLRFFSGRKIKSEKGKLRVEKPERAAVIGRNSVAGDGVAVGFRGIALIDIPSILRILSGYAAHIFVTMGLGKD